MNEHSSRKAFSIRIEAVWRKFDIASKYRSDNEQLIKDKIEFDDRKND